ncbi:MAG: single-stranded DNA-binding protein [Clostridia bacterium]|nr:single-stranded DNA-binding protein [Clostridia bacterium]
MNKALLIGRIAGDVVLRYSSEELAIASFTIAADRPPKKDGTKSADFPRVTVFGKQAENCQRFLEKGSRVAVEGRIQTGSYTKQDGTKVYTTEVVAERVEFIDFKLEANTRTDFEPVPDDLPF